MKKIILFIAVIAIAFTITVIQSCKPSGKASGAKMLKFNPEKGNGYDYDIVWDMDQKMMGQESKISIGSLYSIKVIDEADHIKTLTGTYRNFKMNMNIAGMEIDVDTDKPSPPMSEDEIEKNPMGMMNRVFASIVGKSFSMKVDEEGKVIEVAGFDKLMESMADSLGLGEEMKEKMVASFKDQFNEQTVKDQFAQVFMLFPNKEVKVGDSWEKNHATGGKMPAKYSTTYTVKEIEGNNVALTTKTNIESIVNDDNIEIKGDQTGNLIVDSKSGLMLNGDFTQELHAKIQGMTMTINGKGKIKGKAN